MTSSLPRSLLTTSHHLPLHLTPMSKLQQVIFPLLFSTLPWFHLQMKARLLRPNSHLKAYTTWPPTLFLLFYRLEPRGPPCTSSAHLRDAPCTCLPSLRALLSLPRLPRGPSSRHPRLTQISASESPPQSLALTTLPKEPAPWSLPTLSPALPFSAALSTP